VVVGAGRDRLDRQNVPTGEIAAPLLIGRRDVPLVQSDSPLIQWTEDRLAGKAGGLDCPSS
jgi:hypothetical protein